MYQTLLFLHIATASVALPTGLIPILTKKGGKAHRFSGLVYYYSMYGVATSALAMTMLKWNPFLMCIGIFSLFMTYTGKRALWYFRKKEPYQPGLKDKIPIAIALVTGAIMVLFPVLRYDNDGIIRLSVLQIFGIIQLIFSVSDLRTIRNAANFVPGNPKWLRVHIARMGGSYISTTTAFLVVNVNFSPGWVLWLAPSAVGTMLITTSIRKLQNRGQSAG